MSNKLFPKLNSFDHDLHEAIHRYVVNSQHANYILPSYWFGIMQIQVEDENVYSNAFGVYLKSQITQSKAATTRADLHFLTTDPTYASTTHLGGAFRIKFRLKHQAGATESTNQCGSIDVSFHGNDDENSNLYFATNMVQALLNFLQDKKGTSVLELDLADLHHDPVLWPHIKKSGLPGIVEF